MCECRKIQKHRPLQQSRGWQMKAEVPPSRYSCLTFQADTVALEGLEGELEIGWVVNFTRERHFFEIYRCISCREHCLDGARNLTPNSIACVCQVEMKGEG
jgi:hypothetical protein